MWKSEVFGSDKVDASASSRSATRQADSRTAFPNSCQSLPMTLPVESQWSPILDHVPSHQNSLKQSQRSFGFRLSEEYGQSPQLQRRFHLSSFVLYDPGNVVSKFARE